MDPACSLCQVAITFHESLRNEEQTNLLQALKSVSNSDSRKHTCNLLDEICKAESPLQVPLCKDCATKICSDLRKRLLDLEGECLKYENAYSDQQKKRKSLPYDAESIRRELQDLTMQEKELLEELTNLESEERRINNDIRELSRQASDVNEEGDAFYRELRSNHRKLIECNEDTSSLKTEITYMEEQIKNLRAVNVLDMTFCVGIHESYGTINGLRLGRLPHEVIEWNEINAAFGQVALLVQVLGEKVGATFSEYEIDPRGNNSYIRRITGSKAIEYPLFGNGGWKPFGQLNLDHAIVGLIYCIMQVEGKLKELHKNKENILPYRMEGDRIFENEVIYRVKMQFNSEERWTKAMKLLLMNLKRLVALAPHTIVQKV
jgi:beclin 1